MAYYGVKRVSFARLDDKGNIIKGKDGLTEDGVYECTTKDLGVRDISITSYGPQGISLESSLKGSIGMHYSSNTPEVTITFNSLPEAIKNKLMVVDEKGIVSHKTGRHYNYAVVFSTTNAMTMNVHSYGLLKCQLEVQDFSLSTISETVGDFSDVIVFKSVYNNFKHNKKYGPMVEYTGKDLTEIRSVLYPIVYSGYNGEVESTNGHLTVRKYKDYELYDESNQEGKVGTEYTVDTTAPVGYELKRVLGKTKGQYTTNSQSVNLYYEKVNNESAPILISYRNENGEDIISQSTIRGIVGEKYAVDVPDIAGYNYSGVEGKPTGVYSYAPQVVVLKYTRNAVDAGVVTVRYTDENGESISDEEVLRGELGEQYTTKKRDISGYTFLTVNGGVSGVFQLYNQRVTYIYYKGESGGSTPEVPTEPEDVGVMFNYLDNSNLDESIARVRVQVVYGQKVNLSELADNSCPEGYTVRITSFIKDEVEITEDIEYDIKCVPVGDDYSTVDYNYFDVEDENTFESYSVSVKKGTKIDVNSGYLVFIQKFSATDDWYRYNLTEDNSKESHVADGSSSYDIEVRLKKD